MRVQIESVVIILEHLFGYRFLYRFVNDFEINFGSCWLPNLTKSGYHEKYTGTLIGVAWNVRPNVR